MGWLDFYWQLGLIPISLAWHPKAVSFLSLMSYIPCVLTCLTTCLLLNCSLFSCLWVFTHISYGWNTFLFLDWLEKNPPTHPSICPLKLCVVMWSLTSPGKKVFLLYRSAPLFGVTAVGLCCHLIPLCIPSLEQTWIQFKNTCCVPHVSLWFPAELRRF